MSEQQDNTQKDLFAQVIGSTKEVIDGAGDAYRDTYRELQEKLPTFDEVIAKTVFSCCSSGVVMDGLHDIVQLGVYFFRRPAVSHGVL